MWRDDNLEVKPVLADSFAYDLALQEVLPFFVDAIKTSPSAESPAKVFITCVQLVNDDHMGAGLRYTCW